MASSSDGSTTTSAASSRLPSEEEYRVARRQLVCDIAGVSVEEAEKLGY